ncbi:glycosyl transferase [Desulforhabdus sp. TSK]|nr:glycosyl transferase [Desulforhabdus sp. TSK]
MERLNLNVLFWVRPDFHSYPGGDTVQLHSSAAMLRELGCEVTLSSDPGLDPSLFDVIHLWHLERCHDTWLLFQMARKSGKPILLSPIYWPWNHLPLKSNGAKWLRGFKEDGKNWIRFFNAVRTGSNLYKRFIAAALRTGWLKCREAMLNGVSMLLPNSPSEAEILRAEKSSNVPILVVPNVVDDRKCGSFPRLPWNERDLILCVGHFCPRKNQLALIDALKGSSLSVTFIGGLRPMHRGYFEHCRRVSSGRHHFLGNLSHDDVLQLMGRAKAHIHVSKLETPGLVNLEAALMGCNLVLPPVAPVRDYFGSLGNYIRSYAREDIRRELEKAVSVPPNGALEEHVRRNFTQDQLRQSLFDAYACVVRR